MRERERERNTFLIVLSLPSFLRRYFQYFIFIWGIMNFTHKIIP